MRTLAFDTSTKFLSVACLEGDEVKASFHEDAGIRHSEVLVPTIQDTVKKAGWHLSDIELICAGLGPGSFTGLRIGIATLKGLAAVLGAEVAGVPSMDAIVREVPDIEGLAAPLLDARKGKVYSCIYRTVRGEPVKKTGYLLVTMEELLGALTERTVFFGEGVAKYRSMLEAHPLAEIRDNADWYPRAVEIGRLGISGAGSGTDDPADIEPLYLHAKECNIIEG